MGPAAARVVAAAAIQAVAVAMWAAMKLFVAVIQVAVATEAGGRIIEVVGTLMTGGVSPRGLRRFSQCRSREGKVHAVQSSTRAEWLVQTDAPTGPGHSMSVHCHFVRT
mmetsp:Transcript_52090/g.108755  ORF Transcript_52090/g.108755 Transcript_52090/m.108755 type:complete len:109 (+) Transcript_52090:139-465(+)